ncbi:signal peptidase I [Enterococcus plantarum]|uniref:signal peptidase I n=1 Tax=Enterococcus plantarum TaxID=1077675 RepID=UPI0030F93238
MTQGKNNPKKKRRTVPSVKERPRKKKGDESIVARKKRKQQHIKKRQLSYKRPVNKKKKRKRKLKQLLNELGLTILITFSLLIIVKQLTFSLPKIEGYSMLNTLMDQDRVFVNKLSKVKRFSLVYYRDATSKELAVRRIIGLPEERFYYKEDQLFVEDKRIPERFLVEVLNKRGKGNAEFTEDFTLQEITKDQQIPKGKYFVLGDNRPYATDSRDFGYIDEKDIIGVVKMKVMPFHQMQAF